jgi:hypothetical protein
MSDAAKEYEQLQRTLHALSREGKPGGAIYDQMDAPWWKMTHAEQEEAKKRSTALCQES